MNEEKVKMRVIKKKVNYMEYETVRLRPFLDLFFRRYPKILNDQHGTITEEDSTRCINVLVEKSNLKDFFEVFLYLNIEGKFGYHNVVYPVYKGIFYPNPKSITRMIKKVRRNVTILFYKILLGYPVTRIPKHLADDYLLFQRNLYSLLLEIVVRMADSIPRILIYTENQNREE